MEDPQLKCVQTQKRKRQKQGNHASYMAPFAPARSKLAVLWDNAL